MSTRKSTRTRTSGSTKAAPTKTRPKQAGPKKADPTPDTAPTTQQKAKSNPFCTKCGTRLGPEEGDPFKGSSLLYDYPGFANLTGALFLCGWQSQILQKVCDDRATVIVLGIPVDEAGKNLNNRKMVTATWEYHPEHGWVQIAEKCGYSRPDGTGFQNRTADQLTTYVGNNVAAWMLADIDEDDAPTAPKGKQSAATKAETQAQPAPEPTVDPESKGLPVGSTTEPQPEPAPTATPEPEPDAENPDAADDNGDDQDTGSGEELEVAEEEILAEPQSEERVSA